MNCGRDENPTYHIFIHLDADVLVLIQSITWENLIPKVTMGYFLDTRKLQRHSKCIT